MGLVREFRAGTAPEGNPMKYRMEHEFPCDGSTLVRTLFDRGIVERLLPRLTRITEAETLSWSEENGRVRRRVRYLPVPAIRSVGPKKVEPRWMEWVEESEADLKTGVVTYRNVPTTPGVAALLKNHGEMRIRAGRNGGAVREVSGELKVEVFLLGAIAERLIYSYAKEILDEEARAVADLIREGDRA